MAKSFIHILISLCVIYIGIITNNNGLLRGTYIFNVPILTLEMSNRQWQCTNINMAYVSYAVMSSFFYNLEISKFTFYFSFRKSHIHPLKKKQKKLRCWIFPHVFLSMYHHPRRTEQKHSFSNPPHFCNHI